ncbi:MAG TPA: glycine zipper 2TM domain-containing protein [Rhodanobacteraceae bacterium]|nr:glycine zipper 2TM domain-containing protein [Rhodanobacteraceae bacterium]
MNKPVIAGVAIAALGIIAAVAISAHYVAANGENAQIQTAAPMSAASVADAQPQSAPAQQFAQVVAVQPITRTSNTENPRQVCEDVQVVHQEPYKDKNQVGGAVVGGVVGGLLGHQIGGGKGKTLATVGGAAAGAFAGHEIQKQHQQNNATYTTTENRCHTVVDKSSKTHTVGYDVTYLFNGQPRHARMDRNPGVGTGLPVNADGSVTLE